MLDVIKKLTQELMSLESTSFLTAFSPYFQSYYDIVVRLKNTRISDIVDTILNYPEYRNGKKVNQQKQLQSNNNVVIKQTYKDTYGARAITITNEDVLKGDIYFDKFYDDMVFQILTTTIAKHFCPCFISSFEYYEEEGLKISYTNEKDKTRIETYFNSFNEEELVTVQFIKIEDEQ